MIITRRSPIDGIERSRDLDCTAEQFEDWEKGALAQHAFPNLAANDREFIMTGITSDQWEDLFDEEAK